LRFGFDGAGSGNQRKMNAANEHVTGRRGNPDHRVFFFGLSADQFVGLADGNALCDAGQGFEDAEIDRTVIPSDSDGGASRSRNRMRLQAEGLDALAHGAYLFFGGMRMHYN
jgi:hypothetical protein